MESLHLLLRILLRLEEKSVGTAGVLPVHLRQLRSGDNQQAGMIMAEGGRLCWASSPRASSRLSDLLLAVSGISRGQIEKVFQFCRRTGKPLGEHMVSLGILTRDQLRDALLSHTTAALFSLGRLMEIGEASPAHFRASDDRTYNPMFTFSALELVVEMLQREPDLRVAAGPAPPTFERWTPQVQHAICFLETAWEDIPGIPIRYRGAVDMSLGDALQLFRHCRDPAESPALAATASHPAGTVVRHGDQSWLASYSAPHLCLFRVDSPML